MKNVGISTGHCGFTDTFSNNIINDWLYVNSCGKPKNKNV